MAVDRNKASEMDDTEKPEWLKAAIARIEAQREYVLCDTQEKALDHGVPLGTTVIVRKPPSFTADGQQNRLDDFMAREYLRNGR
jgi:hypothetical protein